MTIALVVNAGSSSLKHQVIDLADERVLAAGVVERIGEPGSPIGDHVAALEAVLAGISGIGVDVVGHRVVHGGERFDRAAAVDDEVEEAIGRLAVLAPLHNPAALAGIRAARAALPSVPQVAVFDTAFHATLPEHARTYALDAETAHRHGIRRYGFHGTSFRYVSGEAARLLGRTPDGLRMIVLHLGNGASAAAIADGRSIDTSMGLTPLEGLVMGTRSGDLDPAILPYLHRVAGLGFEELDELLNSRSGLRGLSGHSDLRELLAAISRGDARAGLALEVYVHRLRRYLGAYAVELSGADAIVFTGGVGENSPLVRARALDRLGFLGVELDLDRNEEDSRDPRVLSTPGSRVAVLVVPTREELQIAREAAEVLAARGDLRP